MDPLVQEVETRIKNTFWDDLSMEFIDEKWDGKHFYLVIISELFTGLSRIERSRKVHDILSDLLVNDSIHALRLKLRTPEEA
jgi:acid stress-induced BolA-like protein IbaG/YrbA